jgi:hypothetical protein
MKAKVLVVVGLVMIALCSHAIAGGTPAPFGKAKEMALRQPVKVHTDGTGYQRCDIKCEDLRVSLGYDGQYIWISSDQWTGQGVVIIYHEKNKTFHIVTGQMELQVQPNEVKLVIEKAFEVFRELVKRGLI